MRAFKSYFLKAISNLWRNRTMSFMAMATIVFSLVLLGCSLILGNNITYISEQLEGQYEIHAYIDLSYSEEEAISLRSEIECIDFVKSAEFVSKDQALADMVASMEDARPAFEMLEGDENPLPHAFDITLTDVKKADEVVAQISLIEGVDEVKNRSNVLSSMVSTTRSAQLAAMVGMLIFAFIGIFIISNTIKMSVASRSREIEIMKYVGATDWYIRWPFVIEGIILGFLGAIVAFGPVCLLYGNIVKWWTKGSPMFNLSLVPTSNLSVVIIVVFLVIGCILGAVGSVLSIRKHLRV